MGARRFCQQCGSYREPHDHGPTLFDEPLTPLRDPRELRDAPAHRDAVDTERAAAVLVVPRSGTWRLRVLEAIARAPLGGMTDWELHSMIGGNLYTIAPRRNELLRDGWVRDSGKRRNTNNGRGAVVWILTDQGSAQWRELVRDAS